MLRTPSPFKLNVIAVALIATLSAPVYAADDPTTQLIVLEKCPTMKPEGGAPAFSAILLSVIATPVINAVVDAAVTGIKKAAEESVVELPAPAPNLLKFYRLTSAGGDLIREQNSCVISITGHFADSAPVAGAAQKTEGQPKWLSTALDELAHNNNIHLVGQPMAYFEAQLVVSDDAKNFSLRPQAVYVGDFQQSSFFHSGKRRYDFAFAYQELGSTKPLAEFSFTYDNIRPGYAQVSCQPRVSPAKPDGCTPNAAGYARQWFPVPAPSADMTEEAMGRKMTAATLSVLTKDPKNPYSLSIDTLADAMATNEYKQYCATINPVGDKSGAQSRAQKDVLEKLLVDHPECIADYHANKSRADAKLKLAEWQSSFAKADLLYYELACDKNAEKDNRSKLKDSEKLKYLQDSYKNPIKYSPDEVKACLQFKYPDNGSGFGDIQLTATTKETRPPLWFAKTAAEIAEASKDDLKVALQNKYDPEKRRQIAEQRAKDEETLAKASRDAKFAVQMADLEVKRAEAELNTARASDGNDESKMLAAEITLLEKKHAANDAYRSAGLTPPYTDVP